MAYLVLVRHGLSEYNKKGLWTGRRDPDLAPEGLIDAQKAGEALKDIQFDNGFSSPLKRHADTLSLILKELGQPRVLARQEEALTERDYGVYTGKNKWEVKDEIGEDEFKKLRRSWNYPVPEGESLKDVSDRVVKFYKTTIEPLLEQNKNVIVSSSGNALRALVKFLENIPEDKISELEIAPGEVYVYKTEGAKIASKDIRCRKENTY